MSDDLDRYLDGDVGADALDATTRADAEAWNRMVESFRTTAPRALAPAWLVQKVMGDIEALPRPATALVVAAFAVVLLLPQAAPEVARQTPGVATAAGGAEPVVYVQFVFEAPGATSVSLAGDFSDWEASVTLTDQNEDGLWTARVAIRPGVYGYMFLIDGTEWQTDPWADRYQDDGFGNRNAVLAVAASE